MKKIEKGLANLLIHILSAGVFVLSSLFFIEAHDLETFKDPLFNIKETFYVGNQTIINYPLRLQKPTFLKIRIKFRSDEQNFIRSFCVNGVNFRPEKVKIKKGGSYFYEYLIPKTHTFEDNIFLIMLSKPLSAEFRINFKNNSKLNRYVYIVFQSPDFKVVFTQLSLIVLVLLILIYYFFIARNANMISPLLQILMFILAGGLLLSAELYFGFSLKSDRYFSLFLLMLIFGIIKNGRKVWFYTANFLKGMFINLFDIKKNVTKGNFSKKSKKFFRNALFSFIGFLIAFSLLEFLSFSAIKLYFFKKDNRVREYEYFLKTGKGFSKRNIASYVNHPYIPYLPDVNVYDKDGLLFNSLGYRSKTLPHDKGIKIICLGCSTTFGWCVKTEDAWPSVLERNLRQYFKRDDIDVINFGIPAAPSEISLAMLHFKALALDPDMVLVLQGINDATHWPENGKRRSDLSDFALRADWPERKLLNPFLIFMSHSNSFRLLLYIKVSSSKGLDIIPHFDCWYGGVQRVPNEKNQSSYKLVPWQEIYARNIRSMIGICKANDIPICLLENVQRPAPVDICDEINEITKKIAKEKEVDYIPLKTHLSENYFMDLFHLTRTGEARRAKEIFKFLIKNKSAIFKKSPD